MILVEIVSTGPVDAYYGWWDYGWWDELRCGHLVPFDGEHHDRRRCLECERVEAATQEVLFA